MTGVELIAAERERQIRAEGFTEDHDDTHRDAELSRAGAAYATAAALQIRLGPPRVTGHDMRHGVGDFPTHWWKDGFWKPSDDPIRNLAKAGALIAAEMDRLMRENEADRAEAKNPTAQQATGAAPREERSAGNSEAVADA